MNGLSSVYPPYTVRLITEDSRKIFVRYTIYELYLFKGFSMAIINNPFLQHASGSVGGMIVYKEYYDKTVISKMPDMSKRVLTAKQLEANERMRRSII